MTNAQIALTAAANFGADRTDSGYGEILIVADAWLKWLDAQEADRD